MSKSIEKISTYGIIFIIIIIIHSREQLTFLNYRINVTNGSVKLVTKFSSTFIYNDTYIHLFLVLCKQFRILRCSTRLQSPFALKIIQD